ncbi:Two-component response regulator ARR2 [Capsicum baccatum]|uniref:Two-component response regulator ARR2 n=1 Tax=Capsicum baccatum TaxID=33114 RepID=A0A2G2WRM9_CAPBA|nr:Two-component response regulator ARR2 [Capsicum baccatum]
MASMSGVGATCKSEAKVVTDHFPVGLRVLVVDDDVVCLRIIEQMLRRCKYSVTTCTQATVALNLLRERRETFDIVLSDVHMPDMDGFKLLELVGLEMDLPVIMMSGDGRTNLVMRGVQHGACDYLIKPIRDEELKNIWQHVVRKRYNSNKEHECSGSLDDNDRYKRGSDDVECASSVVEGADGVIKPQKKKREAKEDDTEVENDDPGTTKKPRVVWSVELHQQFVSAVNQLGIDKAVPKRILELMNVPGLTRENVASHLQKFRLYLKRLSGVVQQQGGVPSTFCGPMEQNSELVSLGRFDIQALAASGQIPPETLTALHAELLGRSTSNLVLPAVEQQNLLQASLQQAKCMPVDQLVAYGQPLLKCPPSISNSKHPSQSILSAEDVHSGFGSQRAKNICMVPSSNPTGIAAPNSNMFMAMMQHQQQWQKQQQLELRQRQSGPLESNYSINVQPSCVVLPSQSPGNFQVGDSPASISRANSLSKSSVVDYGVLSPQSNNSSGVIQVLDGELRPECGSNRLSSGGSLSCSCSINADNSVGLQFHNSSSAFGSSKQLPGLNPNHLGSPVPYSINSSQVLDQGHIRNPVVGKGASIPSRFAVDESESAMCNLNTAKSYLEDAKVKQEPNMNLMENAKVGPANFQKFQPGDLMSVFSD